MSLPSSNTLRPTVLDCTLRDGGFYTNWDYPEIVVRAYVDTMSRAGVDVIELGYRSLQHPSFVGALGYTLDWYLEQLPAAGSTRIAVMLDAKEFADQASRIGELFSRREHSRVSLVRVATTRSHLGTAIELAQRLHDLGYATTINLMAAATLSELEAAAAFGLMDGSCIDVVYIADSFGSMYPEDISRIAAVLRESTNKVWGVHLHNNLELAFSNALEAVRVGATWIDCSVSGMGRGPGNLRTELFLQHLSAKCSASDRDTGPVYEFIGRHMLELQQKYGWGPGPAYILSGFLGAHPTYAQQLLATERYTISEVTRILKAVHASGDSARFDTKVLATAISARHAGPHSTLSPLGLPGLGATSAPWSEKPVVVVGRGGSADAHIAAINEYISRADPIVIECNHVPGVRRATHHFTAYAVAANARATAAHALAAGRQVIVPSDGFVADLGEAGVFVEDYAVREGTLQLGSDTTGTVLPSDVVSMLAISVAARCGAKLLELVGFDGYAGSPNERDRRMQAEMEQFMRLFRETVPEVQLVSLTPTSFSVSEGSIYSRLRDVRRV